MNRDDDGNLVWVERLWAALPGWLRRKVGFLFPPFYVGVAEEPEDMMLVLAADSWAQSRVTDPEEDALAAHFREWHPDHDLAQCREVVAFVGDHHFGLEDVPLAAGTARLVDPLAPIVRKDPTVDWGDDGSEPAAWEHEAQILSIRLEGRSHELALSSARLHELVTRHNVTVVPPYACTGCDWKVTDYEDPTWDQIKAAVRETTVDCE